MAGAIAVREGFREDVVHGLNLIQPDVKGVRTSKHHK
jgi:hypothetical protein